MFLEILITLPIALVVEHHNNERPKRKKERNILFNKHVPNIVI